MYTFASFYTKENKIMRNQKCSLAKCKITKPKQKRTSRTKDGKKETETEKQMPVKANVYGPSSFLCRLACDAMKKRKPATTTLVIGWRIHPSNHAKLGRWLPFFSFLLFALGNLQRCWSTVFATGRVLRTSIKPHPSLPEVWRECGRMLRVRFVCGVDCSPCLLLGGHCGTCNVPRKTLHMGSTPSFYGVEAHNCWGAIGVRIRGDVFRTDETRMMVYDLIFVLQRNSKLFWVLQGTHSSLLHRVPWRQKATANKGEL